ncbi:MAG TPA: hypothetical protein VGQ39_12290 [Pyrinomonadaceae bacterium]|nr:hypothetical protein [Pyrinomonadaceae bacterium]
MARFDYSEFGVVTSNTLRRRGTDFYPHDNQVVQKKNCNTEAGGKRPPANSHDRISWASGTERRSVTSISLLYRAHQQLTQSASVGLSRSSPIKAPDELRDSAQSGDLLSPQLKR